MLYFPKYINIRRCERNKNNILYCAFLFNKCLTNKCKNQGNGENNNRDNHLTIEI